MQSPDQHAAADRQGGGVFFLFFCVVAATLLYVGFRSYRSFEERYRVELERQLTTIAELKIDALVQWRKERLGDGQQFFKNPAFAGLVQRFFEKPEDAGAEHQLQAWVGKVQSNGQYDQVLLLDAQGHPRLALPADRSPVAATVLQRLPEVLRTGQVVLLDFYRNEHDQRIYLAVLVPILEETAGDRPLGVLALRIDPETYLYPSINRWPTPSASAETLLVRREGNAAVCLNALRSQTNAALNLRVPLERTNGPVAEAARGLEGIMEGLDHQSVPALAALRTIPGSPWALVARLDIAEVYAPLRERLGLMVVVISALLFGAGAGVELAWRHQRGRLDRVQQEVAAARTRLSAIVESSDDAIIGKSLDGIITSWNAGAERLYGYSAAEALGKPITMLIPSNQPNEFPQLIAAIQRGETVKHYETERVRKDGQRIAVSLSLSPVKDPSGAIVGASIIGREITERKRAEAALRESELRYRTIFDNSLTGIAQVRPDGHLLCANQAYAAMYGYANPAELIAEAPDIIQRYAHPEDRQEVLRMLSAHGVMAPRELTVLRRDGSRFVVLATAREIRDTAGQLLCNQAEQVDISERKQAEAARDTLAQQRQIALNAANLGWWHYDPATKIARWDERYKEIFGVPGYQCPNEEILARLHPDDRPRVWAAVEAALNPAAPKPYAAEYRVPHPDGSVRWVEAHGQAVFAGAGDQRHATSFVGTVQDITARKQTEAAQVKLEAQNRQLQKSESLGRMAGAIAHHYNNKLQAIMGNLELALDSLPPGSKTFENLNDAMQAARGAAEVSVQMLTYLGKPSGEKQPLYLSAVCRQYLPLLQSTMPVLLETAFADPGPLIHANANQIQQVLLNLVTNAWEAVGSNRGAVRLTIKTVSVAELALPAHFPVEWQPHAGTYACLEVADTGCGIAAAEIEKIFDPFFTHKFLGRGLGLSVVLGIVKAHAGCITVESAPGQGSTFRVYFPVAAEDLLPTPAGALPAPDFTRGGTVLVVEDDEAVCALAAHVIRSMGFSVLTAQDGVAGLDVFRQHQVDIRCVLSDLSMPRMNGWQTITALRQLVPGIPVILASGYDEASVMAENHPDRPQVFLGKPYNSVQLRAALGRVLSGG